MTSSFTITTTARCSARDLFEVSLNIDEHMASMKRSGERAVAGVTSGQIGLGETVTWRARHFGIWWRMTSQISELWPHVRFVDQQLKGPFRFFIHEHEFHEGAQTTMIDKVTLASPVGGQMVERLILVPYLKKLLRQRNESLIASVESGGVSR